MTKVEAIAIFKTVPELARALNVTRHAIYQWPDELPRSTADRVIGAAVRTGRKVPSELLDAKGSELKGAA